MDIQLGREGPVLERHDGWRWAGLMLVWICWMVRRGYWLMDGDAVVGRCGEQVQLLVVVVGICRRGGVGIRG